MSNPQDERLTTSLVVLLRNRCVLKEMSFCHRDRIRTLAYPGEFCITHVLYSQLFNENWTDQNLIESIVILDCHGDGFTKISSLPDLPNCRFLNCSKNALTSLPRLDACEVIDCSNNELQEIRLLPSCKVLSCYSNPLVSLSPLPMIEKFTFDEDLNPTQIVFEIDGIYLYEDYWRKRWSHMRRKYFRLWYLAMLKMKAVKRIPLHEELRFSPDTLIENEYTLAKKSFESKQK